MEGNALMRSATVTSSPLTTGIVDAVVAAVARCLCSLSGGHEDVRKFEPDAKRLYLECIRCLRTTHGCSHESAPHAARVMSQGNGTRPSWLVRVWAQI